jgi:hypothetical protein
MSLLVVWAIPSTIAGFREGGTSLHVLYPFLRSELLFLVVLSVGWFFAQLSGDLPVVQLLTVFGRYSLFVFVIHRIIGQALIFLFNMKDGGYGTFLSLFILLCALSFIACLLRMQFSAIDRFFKTLYL